MGKKIEWEATISFHNCTPDVRGKIMEDIEDFYEKLEQKYHCNGNLTTDTIKITETQPVSRESTSPNPGIFGGMLGGIF